MTIFQIVILVVAVLQAACVGSRTYTDQEKVALAQTTTIYVDVRSDARTLPTGIAGIVEQVEHDVKDKLTRAGLTVAPDRARADAVLQLVFDYSDRRHLDEPSSSDDTSYRHDARSMRIGVSLDHKEVGRVFRHGSSVSPPYDVNLADSPILRSIDSDVLQAL